jgi:hypothetical protein
MRYSTRVLTLNPSWQRSGLMVIAPALKVRLMRHNAGSMVVIQMETMVVNVPMQIRVIATAEHGSIALVVMH